VGVKYSSPYFNPANDILNVFPHMILMACQLYTKLEIFELPIFEPNQHFKDQCEKEGKEPWIEYSEAVRTVISKAINLPLSDQKMEDKLSYKNLIEETTK
jgi:hypothetical protein